MYHKIVIGVRDTFIWFHIEGDRGASYWDNGKSYEDLLKIGIVPAIEEEVRRFLYNDSKTFIFCSLI
jgi:hypothetical protein